MVQTAYTIDNIAEEKPNSVGKNDDKKIIIESNLSIDSDQRIFSLEEAIEEARKSKLTSIYILSVEMKFFFLFRAHRDRKVSSIFNIFYKLMFTRIID